METIMTRRDFLKALGAFGAYGAFAGNRFTLMAAGLKDGAAPKLKFGVLSDIHVKYTGKDSMTFKHTLEWFRAQGVDAVVIAGDMADNGLDEHLMAVSEAWYSVFPNDKHPDGRAVEKVFVTGNHDWLGWTYGRFAEKKYPDKAERDRHVLQADMAGWWEKAFHEPYSPIYSKTIKGFTFIGSHWDGAQAGRSTTGAAFGLVERFMAQNGKKLDPALPFFYVQHPHLKDTCYGPWAWGRDAGIATKTLSAFPNAIAFSGHSHYSLTDERTIWQGAFTSVGTGSLRYTGTPYSEIAPEGYENTKAAWKDAWRIDAAKTRMKISTGDCRQGMLWSVYDDCITVRRREFVSDLDLGPDWVLPLGSSEPRPFAFAERAKKLGAPEFPQGAELSVVATSVKIRGGKSRGGKETIPADAKPGFKVIAPPVVADPASRLYALKFTATTADGKRVEKRVLAEGFNHSLKHKKAASKQWCYFRADELGGGTIRFSATPMNCFGACGKPLAREQKA